MKEFDADRKGSGTMEWAEIVENIQIGCANGCLYCYAAHNAARFERREREKWTHEVLTRRAQMRTYSARDGVIMIPSSHDITPFNVEAFCRVAKLMLKTKNRLLIVSKPRLDCISYVCNELDKWKDQVLFRFTIGSVEDRVLEFWEPYAPKIMERLQALALAKRKGFRTSVSAEPLLGGYDAAESVINSVSPLVTDTIWIGKMNKAILRVWPVNEETKEAVKAIEKAQCDREILRMVRELDGTMIRWKDSIKQVMARRAHEVEGQKA